MSTGTVAYRTVALAGRPAEPRIGEAMLALAGHLLRQGVRVRAVADGGMDYTPHDVELVP